MYETETGRYYALSGIITYYEGTGSEVIIPFTELGGEKITGIGPNAFSGHSEMRNGYDP